MSVRKKAWTAVHWLNTKYGKKSVCGVQSEDALYDSSANMETVTCNNCIKISKSKKHVVTDVRPSEAQSTV